MFCSCDQRRCAACRSRRLCPGKSWCILDSELQQGLCNASVEHALDVQVHYTGTLEDGSVFDSSLEREPLEFEIGGGKVIPGFDDAVMGLAEGEKRKQLVPAERAYGKYLHMAAALRQNACITARGHSVRVRIMASLRLLPHLLAEGLKQSVSQQVSDCSIQQLQMPHDKLHNEHDSWLTVHHPNHVYFDLPYISALHVLLDMLALSGLYFCLQAHCATAMHGPLALCCVALACQPRLLRPPLLFLRSLFSPAPATRAL